MVLTWPKLRAVDTLYRSDVLKIPIFKIVKLKFHLASLWSWTELWMEAWTQGSCVEVKFRK